jgi:Fur family transcriptional regulator, ferric uptake regulator
MSGNFSLGSVHVQLPPAERFAQFLQSHGKRVTPQRQLIVAQVFSHHDHFDAEELMAHLRPLVAEGQVSRPTVYRTLGEFVEAGMLRKMTLDDRSVYEHDYGYPQHDHLYCQHCNKLIEFQSPELERIRDAVARQHAFEVLGHRMFITGICADCRSVDHARGPKLPPRT